jgi:uncharacterized protein YggU (UPF0235/DUF167 family)
VARLTIRVTPRGGRDAIDGYGADGALRLRVSAAPTEGRANDAAIRLLATALGLPPSALAIVGGASARVKIVEVNGLSDGELRAKLPPGPP